MSWSANMLSPMHPGEVLREEFMAPLGLSASNLAESCGVNVARIEDIAAERARIDGQMADALSRQFGTSAQFWLNLQADHDAQA